MNGLGRLDDMFPEPSGYFVFGERTFGEAEERSVFIGGLWPFKASVWKSSIWIMNPQGSPEPLYPRP